MSQSNISEARPGAENETVYTAAPAVALSPLAIALIELALAAGGFGIGTGEFAIMGLLPDVATTYGVTVPQAGYVITAYALGVVIGAPIIAVLAAHNASYPASRPDGAFCGRQYPERPCT